MNNGTLSSRADTLTLSDDAAVEAVLADIPFFCVGLMAFGVFTFFLAMKRVTIVGLYLYIAALLAFGASILDLSQILARGVSETDRAIIGLDAVTGIVNTREVGFSLSIGFRFLFLWSFVAERPRHEPAPPPDTDDASGFVSHSASWRRWGYVGFLLQWSLLGLSLAIPILQIIWRISARRYDTIYMTESTIQVVVSGLFLLKIFLNVFLSPLTPWWRAFLFYTIPAAALMIGLGVGIGNIVFFLFSETTLGRFLQATELYILILYLLISSFYPISSGIPTAIRFRSNHPTSSFVGLEEKRLDSPGNEKQKHPGFILGNRPPPASSFLDPPQRVSTASRVSSWLMERVPGRRPLSQSSWQVDRERGNGDQEITVSDAAGNLSPRVQTLPQRQQDLPLPPRMPATMGDSRTNVLGGNDNRPTTGVSFSSYYNMAQSSRASYLDSHFMGGTGLGSDSPVYGLNGIMPSNNTTTRRKSEDSFTLPSSNRPPTTSSFDELLRQQTELDKSIAALRLFSPQQTDFPPRNTAAATPAPGKDATEPLSISATRPESTVLAKSSGSRSISSFNIHRVESASARSDFSLSIFPEPPPVDLNSLLTAAGQGTGTAMTERSRGSVRFASSGYDDVQSIPGSPIDGPDVAATRFGSQYEITSFIGDLTTPNATSSVRGRPATGSTFRHGSMLSDVESSDGEVPGDETSPVIVTANKAQALRPAPTQYVLGPSVVTESSLPSLGPASASSGLLTSTTGTGTGTSTASMRAFNNILNSAPAVPSPLSNTVATPGLPSGILRNPVVGPAGPRRQATRSRSGSNLHANFAASDTATPGNMGNIVGGSNSTSPLPSRPKLNISNPLPGRESRDQMQTPGVFERPRPPPLVLTSSQPNEQSQR